MNQPCPFCGSAACLLQSKSFCRHTGKLRADTVNIQGSVLADEELQGAIAVAVKTATKRGRRGRQRLVTRTNVSK